MALLPFKRKPIWGLRTSWRLYLLFLLGDFSFSRYLWTYYHTTKQTRACTEGAGISKGDTQEAKNPPPRHQPTPNKGSRKRTS